MPWEDLTEEKIKELAAKQSVERLRKILVIQQVLQELPRAPFEQKLVRFLELYQKSST